MPGSTTLLPAIATKEVASKPQQNRMGTRQPPPVAPRTTSISLQPWQPATASDEGNYGDERYARSASTDSLESSGSSSSGGCSTNNRTADMGSMEYIPTRTVGKTPKLPSHNPLQFVKVQSPLYKKLQYSSANHPLTQAGALLEMAEQQIKLTKEVKITREALKEGEEEWQSNLDNWKSRRRKVSEKVIQRAEEMRQIEAEELLRQEQLLQQQKKIKKFSEIVEKKSTRSFNLDLYIGQGDDSGLGGTPEPDDTLDSQSSNLRSDTSEGMTSEAESVDSDCHKPEKVSVKEPPKVPQKPYCRLKKTASICYDENEADSNELYQHCISNQDLLISDNNSSREPSDVEGHAADTEATSSEEDATFSGQMGNIDSEMESLVDNRKGGRADSASDLSHDSSVGLEKGCEEHDILISYETAENTKMDNAEDEISEIFNQSFKINIKHGDNRGFGFTLKGGNDQGCLAFIENVVKGGPADEVGLKDGDRIISLNGELTVDYSHASLIFSIKQAIYTGILDIVISRSESYDNLNSEKKMKDTRKGKSFAEKLALFSSSAPTPTTNIEETKSNTKLAEAKRESLVLRRRSAFENGNSETTTNSIPVNRRLSCILNTVSTSEKKLEKRHSVDLVLPQNTTHENNFSRKGPPPPVPVKPKIKSKPTLFEANKCASMKSNGNDENVLSPSDSIMIGSENLSSSTQNAQLHSLVSSNILEGSYNVSNLETISTKQEDPVELHKNNIDDKLSSERSSPCFQTNHTISEVISHEDQRTLNCDLQMDNYSNFEVIESNLTDEDFSNFTTNGIDNRISDLLNESETVFEPTEEISDSFCDKYENLSDELLGDIYNFKSHTESCTEKIHKDIIDLSDETTSHFDVQSATECAIDYENNTATLNSINEDIIEMKDPEKVSSIITSACYSTCDIDDISELSVPEYNDIQTEESEVTENKNIQTNTSPLCLSLEKIDEDDVVSASTTTSSDTPDTETVIETLPSNLSPLPNDESNGEDCSKILNSNDEESEQPLEADTVDETSSSEIDTQNFIVKENVDAKDFEICENTLKHAYNAFDSEHVNDNVEQSFYSDQQEDEYARELDESLDQITSLDIIDRIEQSLMDQLQNDDAYEDISTSLNNQIENDVNSSWLYFPEESEFLDDLTPRNVEPPRDPPPPPPPPETENIESKISPISRTNSTKRIKKELWRRRSDFLGLDSPEAIDVDNIPPPPLGLEELLKQEREQTQWLEKQLSLADSEVEIYATDSTYLDSGNYSNNDYSEYYADENADTTKENVTEPQHDLWEENIDEETVIENTYGLQYGSASDNLTSVIEENNTKTSESPQHKVKQNIQSLGAAPKAKIMDSTKWITEKVDSINKKTVEPVLRQTSYNQNYWLAQDGERRRNLQHIDSQVDRRYSMPPVYSTTHPDVTVRTWGDREYEYQQHRPRSAIYDRSETEGSIYENYLNMEKKELQRTQSLDSHREVNFDSGTLESEVHKCSCCGKGLCEGSAMGIEALRLYFHIECFRCCLCNAQLGNGSCGTDVQVKNNQLYCPACFTVD